MSRIKKIAFIHRYGLEGWICCGGHAIPGIVANVSRDTEIHFFGPKSTEPPNPVLRKQLALHELPYQWDRACPTDKITKTLFWYFWLPLIGIRCRVMGIRLIWNDETVPLTAPILRVFYGKNIAITVMDFFMRIYTQNHPRLYWLRDWVEHIDMVAWRKVPLIFTKVRYTQEHLAEEGVPQDVMHLYRNPIDHTLFHPIDESIRKATRHEFGFGDDDIVLSHHGILHPNKGNDWILRRLAELKSDLPNLKYLLIGNGPEMNNLKQLTEELGIADRVVFTGWLPSETELNHALAAADIGLVMRIGQETDHFHMTDTLAHEMACEKAILAVNLKGIGEVIADGQNGFLFQSNTPMEFTGKIRKLASNPALRKRMAAAAHRRSLEISDIDNSSQSTAKLLLEIINRS